MRGVLTNSYTVAKGNRPERRWYVGQVLVLECESSTLGCLNDQIKLRHSHLSLATSGNTGRPCVWLNASGASRSTIHLRLPGCAIAL